MCSFEAIHVRFLWVRFFSPGRWLSASHGRFYFLGRQLANCKGVQITYNFFYNTLTLFPLASSLLRFVLSASSLLLLLLVTSTLLCVMAAVAVRAISAAFTTRLFRAFTYMSV